LKEVFAEPPAVPFSRNATFAGATLSSNKTFMKKRSLIDLIFTPVAYFIPVVFAVSCSKNIPAGSGNQNVCVTRLAPKVGEVGVSGAELDAIYALFNANNLPIANLQFLSLQSVPYSGYQEQVTAVQYFHGLPVFGNEIFLFNGGQLAPGGIMVIPVGPPSGETVLKISKEVQPDGSVTFVREDIYNGQKVQFVPFTGSH